MWYILLYNWITESFRFYYEFYRRSYYATVLLEFKLTTTKKKVALLFNCQIDSKCFYQLIVIHERGFFKYQWDNDSEERNGEPIQPLNYRSICYNTLNSYEFSIFFGICSTPKLSKYATLLTLTCKAIQWVPTDSYSRFIIYALSFILDKLFPE